MLSDKNTIEKFYDKIQNVVDFKHERIKEPHKKKNLTAIVFGITCVVLLIPIGGIAPVIRPSMILMYLFAFLFPLILPSSIGLIVSIYASVKGGNKRLSMIGIAMNGFVCFVVVVFCIVFATYAFQGWLN
ncbi:MAG: hypothetical protein FWH03_08895 [Firmicutes bacterium]|nr:hypothetical protein [Bacillota bacterium]